MKKNVIKKPKIDWEADCFAAREACRRLANECNSARAELAARPVVKVHVGWWHWLYWIGVAVGLMLGLAFGSHLDNYPVVCYVYRPGYVVYRPDPKCTEDLKKCQAVREECQGDYGIQKIKLKRCGG